MDTDFGNTTSCVDPENFSQGGLRDNFDFQLGGGGSEAYFQEFYEFNKFEIFFGGVGGGGHEPPTSL